MSAQMARFLDAPTEEERKILRKSVKGLELRSDVSGTWIWILGIYLPLSKGFSMSLEYMDNKDLPAIYKIRRFPAFGGEQRADERIEQTVVVFDTRGEPEPEKSMHPTSGRGLQYIKSLRKRTNPTILIMAKESSFMIYRVGGVGSGFALEQVVVGMPLGTASEILENCEALDAVLTSIYDEATNEVFVKD